MKAQMMMQVGGWTRKERNYDSNEEAESHMKGLSHILSREKNLSFQQNIIIILFHLSFMSF